MFDKSFELTGKVLKGEELTEDEKKYLVDRNRKYELVRYLVLEHSQYKKGIKMTNFQFT